MIQLGHATSIQRTPRLFEGSRSREKPIADIETCVRTSATCVLANLSLRHGVALDWDDKAFTVKQHEIKPFLKAKYRAPWKLEV